MFCGPRRDDSYCSPALCVRYSQNYDTARNAKAGDPLFAVVRAIIDNIKGEAFKDAFGVDKARTMPGDVALVYPSSHSNSINRSNTLPENAWIFQNHQFPTAPEHAAGSTRDRSPNLNGGTDTVGHEPPRSRVRHVRHDVRGRQVGPAIDVWCSSTTALQGIKSTGVDTVFRNRCQQRFPQMDPCCSHSYTTLRRWRRVFRWELFSVPAHTQMRFSGAGAVEPSARAAPSFREHGRGNRRTRNLACV